MTGTALRKARRAAGLTQAELARKAGIGRHAVSYWETRETWPRRSLPWAVDRIRDVIGDFTLPDKATLNARARGWGLRDRNARAGGWGVIDAWQARLDAEVARRIEAMQAREAARAARRRVICGATTRKGAPCRLKSEPGRRRCKFHGGKSTGPRTAEGKARIAEAQRRRWAAWRAGNTATGSEG